MLKLIYVQYYIISFIMLLVFAAILSVIIHIYKSCKIGKKIEKMTYLLSKSTNSKSIEEYIVFLEGIEIYPREYYWNLIKAAYILALENEELDDNIKNRLRITILGKGIIV